MKQMVSLMIFSALAATAFSGFAQNAIKPDRVKGEAGFSAVCAACHAPDGNAIIAVNPKLAQQHPDYLVKQLQEFKSGHRAHPIMQGMAATLSLDDMRNIAYWLSGNQADPGVASDKASVAMGERLYRGGIADIHVPACAGCHGPNGAGIPAQYPRLGGQHADYVVAQLTAFRDGIRQNSLIMTQVAARLNVREIRAVGDYAAGLH